MYWLPTEVKKFEGKVFDLDIQNQSVTIMVDRKFVLLTNRTVPMSELNLGDTIEATIYEWFGWQKIYFKIQKGTNSNVD